MHSYKITAISCLSAFLCPSWSLLYFHPKSVNKERYKNYEDAAWCPALCTVHVDPLLTTLDSGYPDHRCPLFFYWLLVCGLHPYNSLK